MPLTPFHVGPACIVKSLLGDRFSLTVFSFAQIAMDIEPVVRVLSGSGLKHGYSHSYLGATLIGIFSLFVGKPLCQLFLNRWTHAPEAYFSRSLRGAERITWTAAILGAFVGTYSHVLLDSMMHFDIEPLWPFAHGNALQGLVGFDAMHWICGVAGAVGIAAIFTRHWIATRSPGERP